MENTRRYSDSEDDGMRNRIVKIPPPLKSVDIKKLMMLKRK